ncbi:MAG: T9SS type A sorting domain-containing protein [Bacteroidia bacterium]
MKKIYLTATLTLATVIGFAQTRVHGQITKTNVVLPHSSNTLMKTTPGIMTNGCDTLLNTQANDTAVLYKYGPLPQWGYVTGTNSYGDVSKAEKFLATSYTAGYKLVATAFFFGKAVDGSTPTNNMMVTVWDATGTDGSGNGGAPGAILGTPVAQPISTMQTGGTPTLITFASPITVSSDFFVGLDNFQYATTQDDTVAIYSNTSEHTPAHMGLGYEQWSAGGGWYPWSDANDFGPTYVSDFYIIAILCSPTLGDIQIANPTPEVIVYPNPSNGNVYVSTGSATAGNVSISVIDALGKVVSSSNQYLQKGATAKVEMNNAAAGIYFMNITTNGKTVTKKLTIQ